MRRSFQARTGAFRSEDPWFEPRSRAFWDDALTTQGFAREVRPRLDETSRPFADALGNWHRGLFDAPEVDDRGARLVDLLTGTELLVHHLDEAQAIALAHAEGLVDARVVALRTADGRPRLVALPGAFHHAPDARASILDVVAAAHARSMDPGDVLDALLRMELVFRSSSRVKASFAYRVEGLSRGRAPDAARAPAR